MKHFTVQLLLLLFGINIYAQQANQPAAFTYLLYGDIYPPVKPYGMVKAAGFFINYKGKVYLVTANHVLTGWNGYRQQSYFPKLWYVRLPDARHNRYRFIPLKHKYLRVKNTALPYTQEPDLCFYEMQLPPGYRVNTINSYVHNAVINTGSTLIAFGYPPHKISTKKQSLAVKSEGATLTLLTGTAAGYALKLPDGTTDKINYRAQYPRYEPVGPGYSGSPVFYKKGSTIIFAGVISSGHADLVHIVKPHFLEAGLKTIKY